MAHSTFTAAFVVFVFASLAFAQQPIVVQSILPGPTSSDQTSVFVQGRDAITVVYSAAVIALGSDFAAEIPANLIPFTFNGANVPGKTRWVTTSIARFDPDIDWPADLDFTVTVNALTSFEGRVVTSKSQRYVTESQYYYISTVTSERANNYTGNAWSATTRHSLPSGVWIDSLMEVPPDGRITLVFGYPITPSLVGAAFKLTGPQGNVAFTWEECSQFYSNDRCIVVIPQMDALQVDTQYTLNLPAGTKTFTYGGLTAEAHAVTFYGLYSFDFPFRSYNSPTYSRSLALYLRHGLINNSTSLLADLQSAFSITPAVPMTRFSRPTLSSIEIEFTLQANTNYTLNVAARPNVLDGFGQPLRAQSYTWTTAAAASFIDAPLDPFPTFESFTGSDWVVFSRNPNQNSNCKSAPHIDVTPIDLTNIQAAIASLTRSETSYMGANKISKNLPVVTTGDYDVTIIPAQTSFGSSGIFIQEVWGQCSNWQGSENRYKQATIVSRNTIGSSIVFGDGSLAVWVTDLESNNVIANAKVTVYGFQSSVYSPSDVLTIASGTTDSNGLYTFQLSGVNVYWQAYVLVQSGAQMHLSDGIYLSSYSKYDNGLTWISQMITDRSFHAPGETVYVKGYVRQTDYLTGVKTIASASSAELTIQWRTSDKEAARYPVVISDQGTFSASVQVPIDARMGTNNFNLNIMGGQGAGYCPILISNPRIPTTNVNISVREKIVKPGKPIHLDLKVGTYTGQGVPSAPLKLTWTVKRARPYFYYSDYSYGISAIVPKPPQSSVDETGVLNVVMDADGNLINHPFDLTPLLKNPLEEGNTVEIKAEYFSLTKEMVTESASLSVANSELLISVRPTTTGNILPGVPFGLYVGLQDITNGNADVLGQEITVNLYRWDGKIAPKMDPALGFLTLPDPSPVDTCMFKSVSSGKISSCEFKLPSLGKFILLATTKDTAGYTVNAVLNLGRTQEEWRANPLAQIGGINFMADKTSYKVGDSAVVSFFNPFSQSKLLVRFGKSWADSKFTFQDGSWGLQTLSFPLTSACLGGCSVTIFVVAPRGQTIQLPTPVPTSILFDVSNPSFQSAAQIYLNVVEEAEHLSVAIALDRDIVEPGKPAGFTVSVKDAQGSPVQGEIAVFIVNKAVLDLMPHPIVDATPVLRTQTPGSYFNGQVSDNRAGISLETSYNAVKDIIARRIQRNPWVNPTFSLYHHQYGGVSDLDLDDDTFFSQSSAPITEFPSYSYRINMNGGGVLLESDQQFASGAFAPGMPPPAPMSTGSSTGTSSTGGGQLPKSQDSASAPPSGGTGKVGLRTNFVTTPKFIGRAVLPASGSVWVNWTLPDNIGTFEIRAYALSSKSTFGSATKDQISRRTLSLQSSAPRVIRNGDVFLSGVTVTVHDPDFSGEVSVGVAHVCELLSLQGDSIQTIKVQGATPVLVNFQFKAIGNGKAFLLYTANVSGQVMDAALYPQSVYGQQEAVYIATSFAVTAGQPSNQGFDLPAAVSFSGVLDINAGVGRLPAVLALSQSILDQVNVAWDPSSLAILASLSPRPLLEQYKATLGGVENAFNTAFLRLPAYTVPNYGLQYSAEHRYPFTSVRLQAFGILVLDHSARSVLTDDQQATRQSLQTQWRAAMDRQLVDDCLQARQYKYVFSNFEDLAYVFLAAGTSWVPQNADSQTLMDLSLTRLIDNSNSLSAAGKAALVTALLRDGVYGTKAQQMLLELTNTMRTQGRTAYLSYGSGAQNPNFFASSLALQAYVLNKDGTTLVEKLANFNAQEEVGSETRYFSSEQLHHLIVALTAYDFFRGNTNPSLDFSVDSAGKNLLKGSFHTAAQTPLESSFLYEELDEKSPITFSATGSGEASIVFGTEFVPAEVSAEPIYRGMDVKKVIQKLDTATNKPTGPALTSAKAGDLVVVTIQVVLPDYSAAVDIVDPVIGAMDALDDNIYGTSSDNFQYYAYPRFYDYWSWYMWGAFSQKEFLVDRVVFHGQNIWAGTHSVSYNALVNTDGEFVLPPAKAFDTFQPELMGLSAGGKFVTKSLTQSDAASWCLKWEHRELQMDALPAYLNIQNPSTNGPDVVPITPDGAQSGGSLSQGQIIGLAVGIPLAALVLIAIVVGAFKFMQGRSEKSTALKEAKSSKPEWFDQKKLYLDVETTGDS